VRTTIRLEEELLQRAKRLARQRGVSLTDIIRESVEGHVSRAARAAPAPLSLPVAGRGGLLPGVELDDMTRLRDVLDGSL